MEDRILCLHPEGKQGVNISREKYEQMRTAIVEILKEKESAGFTEMGDMLVSRLTDSFDGSILWYYTTVKLDLEARGEIERFKQKGRQQVRLTSETI
ncbi:MAG: hypothetical protein AAFQ68_17695 [Bacteroidota bacterium]